MAMLQALAGGLLGIALGMRHALEPDHLAAVSTLVTEERSPRAGAKLGALWGIGHTAALLAVGLALALLRARMPEGLADVFEFGVALMLVGLGSRAILRAVRDPSTLSWTFARRPLLVGIVHGLAGSGALTALALAEMPSASLRMLYMLLFGAGSVLGMAVLSGIAGWPLARIGKSPRAGRCLSFATGAISAGLGIVWGFPFLARWSL